MLAMLLKNLPSFLPFLIKLITGGHARVPAGEGRVSVWPVVFTAVTAVLVTLQLLTEHRLDTLKKENEKLRSQLLTCDKSSNTSPITVQIPGHVDRTQIERLRFKLSDVRDELEDTKHLLALKEGSLGICKKVLEDMELESRTRPKVKPKTGRVKTSIPPKPVVVDEDDDFDSILNELKEKRSDRQ
jgi:hypothetical protein